MSSVWHSARLSTTRPMTQMQRAQCNLHSKLALFIDEAAHLLNIKNTQVYCVFVNRMMRLHYNSSWHVQCSLPVEVADALDVMFNLSNDESEEMENALIGMARDVIDDLPIVVVDAVVLDIINRRVSTYWLMQQSSDSQRPTVMLSCGDFTPQSLCGASHLE